VTEQADIHGTAPTATHKPAPFDHDELATRLYWSVPESAFMCRLSVRTVWRLMADPRSGFPQPRKVRGRTLLAAEDVMAFMEEGK
tara:strand:- start:265 stop:519 length:255 start_codon:yes stop_codon:yes gene_type:complete